MKKLIALSFVVVAAGLLNVGCTASGSIHHTSTTKVDTAKQVAFVGHRVAAPAGGRTDGFRL